MRRVYRYLVEPGDESLVRSWSGLVFGICLVSLPVVFDLMDPRTCLIASLTGGIPTALFWRQIVEPGAGPLRVVAVPILLLLGMAAIARLFGGLAPWTYWGGVVLVLSVMRLITGWRDPYPDPSVGTPIEELDPIAVKSHPVLTAVIVLPFLGLLALTIWVIANEIIR